LILITYKIIRGEMITVPNL